MSTIFRLFLILCLVLYEILVISCMYEPSQRPRKGLIFEGKTGPVIQLKVGNNTVFIDQNFIDPCEPWPLFGFKFNLFDGFDNEMNQERHCPIPDVPPLIEKGIKNISVDSGQKIKFDVSYTGSPKPFVTYFKNGYKLIPNERVQQNDSLLLIERAVPQDSGQYTMLAHNPLGTDRIDFTIKVAPVVVTTPPPSVCPPKVQSFSDSIITFNDSIQLMWNQVLPNIKYKVELFDNTTKQWKVLSIVPENSIVVKKLRCYLWYKFRVTSLANGCESQPLESKNVWVKYSVPDTIPNSITIDEILSDRITISWSAPVLDCGSPISHYIVEKQYFNSSEWKPIGRIASDSRQLIDTNIEGVFKYSIKAVNGFGESVPFVSTNINPSQMIIKCPLKPEGMVEVVEVTRDSVHLKWDQCIKEKTANYTFQIEKLDVGSQIWQTIGNVSDFQIILIQLNCYTEYRFRIRVFTPNCENVILESPQLRTLGSPDSPPAPINVNVVDAYRLLLSWNTPPVVCEAPVLEYTIEKQYNTSNLWVFVNNTVGNQYEDSNIGNTYRYRIRAINKYGESTPLVGDLLTPQDMIPKSKCPKKPEGMVEISMVTRESVQLSWDQSIPEKEGKVYVFQIELMDIKIGVWTLLGKTSEYQTQVNRLKCRTQYKFRIRVFTPDCPTVILESKPIMTSGLPEPPLRPISVIVLDTVKLNLSWVVPPVVCNSPIEGYVIEKQYNTSEEWFFVTKTTGNRIQDFNIRNTYRYRFRSINQFGESEPLFSNFVTPYDLLTKVDCPPNPVGPIQVTDVNRNSVQLWWEKNIIDKKANYNFEIEISEANTGVWKPMGKTTAFQTLVNQLKCVTQYTFRVKVMFPKCPTLILESPTVRTSGKADPPPKPITVIVYGPNRLNISWTPVPPVCDVPIEGYIIERQYENSEVWLNVGKATDSRLKDLNIANTFRYRIRTANRYGLSLPLISKYLTPIEMWRKSNEVN